MSDQTPQAGAAPGRPGPMTDAEVRQWAGLAHLGGILGFLPSLIIWLMKKDQNAFVGQEAAKALNFQLTMAIGWIGMQVLDVIFLPGFIASLAILAIWVAMLVFSILGFQAVNRGQAYTYPFSIAMVK